jgi:transcriptional regulator with GAF, ATPase, and Fis domain
MAGDRQPEGLATALAGMARDLLSQDSLQDTLDRIVTYARKLVEGCDRAGITVVRKGSVSTVAHSDEAVLTSDRIQDTLREGPCFDAAREGQQSYLIPDMAADAGRWPRYGPRAEALDIHSMLSFRLFTDTETLGALNLFSSRTGAFGHRSEQVGWLLASHAAVAFASARSDEHLHVAISSRQDIGIATGILMERHRLSAAEAFDVLSRASQRTNTKLREVARRVAETGEDPGAM